MGTQLLLIATSAAPNTEYWLGHLFGSCLDGAVCGLLPLIIGVWGQARIAYVGFACCVAAALVGGFGASALTALAFSAAILIVRARQPGTGKPDSSQPPTP